jgi:rsbT co-antagonist protein RsbR
LPYHGSGWQGPFPSASVDNADARARHSLLNLYVRVHGKVIRTAVRGGEPAPVIDAVTALAGLIQSNREEVRAAWLADREGRFGALDDREFRGHIDRLLDDLGRVRGTWDSAEFGALKEHVVELSRAAALRGATPSETATLIFSLKEALSPVMRLGLADASLDWEGAEGINRLIDRMGLLTFEAFIAGREAMILEQQRSILELSTPVVELWHGILALPIVGTVDSLRTQQIMENLLQRIVDTGAQMVLIDITGVPVVDTMVAKHLLQTVTATRLLGAEAILVGISPRIAQTLVHLGVDLGAVTTRATLARGLELALTRTHQQVVAL